MTMIKICKNRRRHILFNGYVIFTIHAIYDIYMPTGYAQKVCFKSIISIIDIET